MESVLFVPSVRATAWVGEVLPGTSPAELPVAGRRIVDYSLEVAHRFGFLFAEILDWQFSEQLAADFSELTRTGYPVFYMKGEGDAPKGLADIEGLSTPLTQTIPEGLVVVWGLCVVTGVVTAAVPPDQAATVPLADADVADTPPGVYRRAGGKWVRLAVACRVVDGIATWHALNFAVLRRPDYFTLPGYSAEKDVHLGRNVVLERGTRVTAPALLQDNVWCARNVQLDGDVVIGANSFIAEGATLARTIVCDNTFIGLGLELDGKIVAGNRIIDVATGAWTDVEDSGVASRIADKKVAGVWTRIVRFLFGDANWRKF